MAEIDPEILSYYERGRERERLALGRGRLEEVRTRDVLERCLPAGGRVLDVGGGTGPYAAWLAGRGYQVELIDAVPLHVEQAQRLGREAGFTARIGDARGLPHGEAAADAVLLLGPLYHLPDRGDRLRCLQEAARVLRPGGVVVAAAISRFASLIDAVRHDLLEDDEMTSLIARDIDEGVHRNPRARPGLFTTAYFHRPEELAAEVAAAGFDEVRTCAVEGFVGLLSDEQLAEALSSRARAQALLSALRDVESEPSLLGATGHLLAIARRP